MPDHDPPPAYSELPENGSVSVEEGVGVHAIRRYDVQTTRPSEGADPASASLEVPPSLPPRRSSGEYTPPSGPPPRHSPRPSESVSVSSSNQHLRPPNPPSRPHSQPPSRPASGGPPIGGPPMGPPPTHTSLSGRPPPSPGRTSPHFKPSGNYYPPPPSRPEKLRPSFKPSGHYQPPGASYGPPNGPPNGPPYGPPTAYNPVNGPPPPSRPYLRYPPHFYCPKCHNTGVKIKKGTSCKDCWERFGVRSGVQYVPSNAQPVFTAPPRVVRPGDPSIGGVLCGRCRGKGMISDFFFETSCPVCHGVGRVF